MSNRHADDSRAEPHGSVAGVLLIVATVLLFACMDGSAKWLGRAVNPWQVIAVRYVVAFVAVGVFFNPWTRPRLLRTTKVRLQCVRGLLLVVSTASGWTAVRYITLTKLTSITFASPLIVALLAGPTLGEKIGPRRLAAVLAGFLGVLIVTRPFGGATHPMAVFAAVAAVSNALISIVTRRLAGHDEPETTMFYTGLMGCLVMLPVVPFVWQPPPGMLGWAVLIILGLLGAIAHWLLILAHRLAPASMLAPFYYVQLVGAVTFGLVVFGEVPDRWTLLGSGIVIGSGLYLFYRERIRRKPVPSADVTA